MKTAITFFAITFLMNLSLLAQPGRSGKYENGRNREVAVNTRGGAHHERGTFYFTARERDQKIAAINRDYYRQIESVRRKVLVGRGKKDRIIQSLEMQRRAEIRSVMIRFNDRRNGFHRGGYRNNDRNW